METPLTDAEKKARRAEINRGNAQKGTGPRAASGKSTSRRNGLKHGRHSEFIDYCSAVNPVPVPGESIVDYSRILDALMAKKRPPRPRRKGDHLPCCRRPVGGPTHSLHSPLPPRRRVPNRRSQRPARGLARLRLEIAAAERSIAACNGEFKPLRSFDPFDRPPADFNPATDIAQQIYPSVPKPEEMPVAVSVCNPYVVEKKESAPTEATENSESQSQPKPTTAQEQARAEHGYSIVLPPRRAPQRAEPAPKVRAASS